MKNILTSLIIMLATISFAKAETVSDRVFAPLSTMSAGEVSDFLAMAPKPAKRSVVEVSADDMMTKVYGLLDPDMGRDSIVSETGRLLSLTPSNEDGVLWLDSAEGFRMAYSGMSPVVSAMVRCGEDNKVADFGFFFQFPYSDATREAVNRDQAAFCGSLLQEMHDMGVQGGVNSLSNDLFEVIGMYSDNSVDVRLIDDNTKYILVISVTPMPAGEAMAMTAE